MADVEGVWGLPAVLLTRHGQAQLLSLEQLEEMLDVLVLRYDTELEDLDGLDGTVDPLSDLLDRGLLPSLLGELLYIRDAQTGPEPITLREIDRGVSIRNSAEVGLFTTDGRHVDDIGVTIPLKSDAVPQVRANEVDAVQVPLSLHPDDAGELDQAKADDDVDTNTRIQAMIALWRTHPHIRIMVSHIARNSSSPTTS